MSRNITKTKKSKGYEYTVLHIRKDLAPDLIKKLNTLKAHVTLRDGVAPENDAVVVDQAINFYIEHFEKKSK